MYYFREVNVKKQSQENPKIPNQSDTRSSWWRYHLKHFSDFYVTRRWLQGVKNGITSRVEIFIFPETSESFVRWLVRCLNFELFIHSIVHIQSIHIVLDHQLSLFHFWTVFERETPTHISATHAFSKKFEKKIKSDFHGIGPKFLYPRNQHESLNQFQFFKIKKSPTQKSCVDFKSRNST